MNYPQLVNNNYECDKYNIHRYLDELQTIKSEQTYKLTDILKYTVNKNRVILKFIALIVEIYLNKKNRLWNGI